MYTLVINGVRLFLVCKMYICVKKDTTCLLLKQRTNVSFLFAAGQHKVDSDSEGDIIKLHHIYKFVTGLEEMPACGWNPPLEIAFIKQDVDIMGVGASTCIHQLQLPVPLTPIDPMPSRKILFDLFNKSFADEFFGKV